MKQKPISREVRKEIFTFFSLFGKVVRYLIGIYMVRSLALLSMYTRLSSRKAVDRRFLYFPKENIIFIFSQTTFR